MTTMQEIVDGMRRGEARLTEMAGRLTAEDLEKECYAGGWKVHDTLCHVSTHGQGALTRLVAAGLPAETDPEVTAIRQRFTGPGGFDLHAYNDAVAVARRPLPIAKLADLLRKDHDQVANRLASLQPSDLERPLPPPPGPWRTLGDALAHMAEAENEHLDDVEAALRRK